MLYSLTIAIALADGPVIVLTEDDQAIEDAGVDPVGQPRSPIFAGLWEKGFLKGREDEKVVLGGYFETEYHDDFDQPSYFDQHRLVLFLYARPRDRITFATEIEWEHGGTPRKSNGELNVGEVLIEFAVADFRLTDAFQARAGIVLVPMGAYNLRHDAPAQDITTRPLVSSTVLPSTWFETGAGFFGKIPVKKQRFDYELYAINGLDSKIYDELGVRAARGSLGEDNNDNKALVGRFAWRPSNSVEVALSGYHGAYDPASERFVNLGALDVTARWKFLEFQGEAALADLDAGFDEGWAEATRQPVPEGMAGFYGQVNAHFFPGFLRNALPPELAESVFTASLRYEEVDTDRAATTAGDRSRSVVCLNYRPVEPFVFKNELLLDTNGASGSLARPFSQGWRPSPGFVSSVAVAF